MLMKTGLVSDLCKGSGGDAVLRNVLVKTRSCEHKERNGTEPANFGARSEVCCIGGPPMVGEHVSNYL